MADETKREKIKKHFQDNKKVYIAVGITAVVTVAGTLIAVKMKSGTLVSVKPIQVLTWKSNQTVEVYIEALGDPGNIIQDLTTGTVYASQGQIARALEVAPARITEHLQGKLPDVKGHVLKKLGKAAVAA